MCGCHVDDGRHGNSWGVHWANEVGNAFMFSASGFVLAIRIPYLDTCAPLDHI